MNIGLSLKLQVTVKPDRWLGLNIKLFNDGDTDYFIDRGSFSTSGFPNLAIRGPSLIPCIKHSYSGMEEEESEEPSDSDAWHLPSRNYIELGSDYALSGGCYFREALPGIYNISSTAGLFLYENKDLTSFVGCVRIVGSTSFELE